MYLKYLQNFFDDDDPDDCICNAASLVPKVMSKLKASRIDFYDHYHCVKSICIWSYSGPNAGKCRTE